MLSAGLAYTFSIYSEALKSRFGISQTQLGGLGTACNLGGYLALPAGLVFDGLKCYNRSLFCATVCRTDLRHIQIRYCKDALGL